MLELVAIIRMNYIIMFLNLQKKLIRMGAKITADGIMGPRTRAAIQKFMKTKKTSASPILSKRTSSIKTTPSKFGGRISMSARST